MTRFSSTVSPTGSTRCGPEGWSRWSRRGSFVLIHEAVSWLIVVLSSVSPFYVLFRLLGFTGFQRLTSYEETAGTPLHSLNPLTMLTVVFAVTVISAQSIWWVGMIVGLSSIPFFHILRRLRLVLALSSLQILAGIWGYAFFVSPSVVERIFGPHLTVIWSWPSYFVYMGFDRTLTLQAMIYSLQVSMRVWAMSMFSLLFLATTTPSEVIRAFHRLKVPMPLTFAVTVAMASIPRIFDTSEVVYRLQLMKGVGSHGNPAVRPLYRLKAILDSIVPLAIHEFRKARTVAISAETRAFMAYRTRTEVREVAFTSRDKAIIASLALLIALDTYLAAAGYIPALPFNP